MAVKMLRILVVAAVIATTASFAIGTYLRGQQQCVRVTLVPDGRPSEEEIRQSIRVLSERAKAYGEDFGVARMSLRASEEGTVSVTLWVERDPAEFLKRFIRVGDMAFRFVAPKKGPVKPADGYEKVSWRQTYFSLEKPGEVYEAVAERLVKKRPELCVGSFRSVSYHTEELATVPVLTIEFHPEDAKAFNEIRRKNHGKELAVVVDGEVLVSAVIADGVETDRIQLRGIRGTTEAKRVANVLKIGALPIKFSIEEVEVLK